MLDFWQLVTESPFPYHISLHPYISHIQCFDSKVSQYDWTIVDFLSPTVKEHQSICFRWKSKEVNSPNQIKMLYIAFWYGRTPRPLQRDSHHRSSGSANPTCLPFGFLPRRNGSLLMQVSVQDFHSQQSSSLSGDVGFSPLTGRGLRTLSKRLSAVED